MGRPNCEVITMALIDDVRGACRISTVKLDNELTIYIEAAKKDLGIAGVTLPETLDDIVKCAIITFCKMKVGIPEDYDRLKASYDEQKAQLSNASGYTEWSVNNNV